MRTLARTATTFRQTLPRNTRVFAPASIKPRTTTTSARIKPALKRSTNTLDQDAGNYLTGASTLSYGDAVFLFVAGIVAVWIGGEIHDEVKDVVWPKVKWMKGKAMGEDDDEGK